MFFFLIRDFSFRNITSGKTVFLLVDSFKPKAKINTTNQAYLENDELNFVFLVTQKMYQS